MARHTFETPSSGTRRIALVWMAPAVAAAALTGASAAWWGSESAPGVSAPASGRDRLAPAFDAWRQRDFAKAESVLRAALKADPKDLKALSALGRLLVDVGRTKEAKSVLDQALALDPKHVDTLRALAELQTGLGRHDLAVALWNRACRASPEDFQLWRGLAHAASRSNDAGLAMSAIQKSLKINPDQEDLRRLMTEVAAGERGSLAGARHDALGAFPRPGNRDRSAADPLRHLPENLRPRMPNQERPR